jgi:hypothetical protein
MKGFQVGDNVIGGHDEENGVPVFFLQGERYDGQGRGSIAADGLEHKALGSTVDSLQLFERQEAVFFIAGDDGGFDFGAPLCETVQAHDCLLQERARARQA